MAKYQQSLVERALVLVQRMGPPTYFITFTCNSNWPEIQENLLPGQTSSDRPILVARVFKLKLKHFLDTISKWDGGCAYYLCTVEFQPPRSKMLHIRRMQFPLTLCYALTNNKAQGQTLSKIAIDQRNDSFSHGHTYVAFGR
eukprot:COSAG01_NODE_9779_length_2346_cov_2.823320_3_plen_141_part_01